MNHNWEEFQVRFGAFTENARDLWLQANTDQRTLLVIMVCFSVMFFVLAGLVLRSRILNRHRIRRARHFAAMRNYALEMDDRSPLYAANGENAVSSGRDQSTEEEVSVGRVSGNGKATPRRATLSS